jgi:hypothetical protein
MNRNVCTSPITCEHDVQPDEQLQMGVIFSRAELITKGIKSDSFASHFANHCKKETKPTRDELRKMMKVKIIWQGNAISCMKLFGN